MSNQSWDEKSAAMIAKMEALAIENTKELQHGPLIKSLCWNFYKDGYGDGFKNGRDFGYQQGLTHPAVMEAIQFLKDMGCECAPKPYNMCPQCLILANYDTAVSSITNPEVER